MAKEKIKETQPIVYTTPMTSTVVNGIKVGNEVVKSLSTAGIADKTISFVSSDESVTIAPTANVGEIDFTVDVPTPPTPDIPVKGITSTDSSVGIVNTNGTYNLSVTNGTGVTSLQTLTGAIRLISPNNSLNIAINQSTKEISLRVVGKDVYQSFNLLDELNTALSHNDNGQFLSDFIAGTETAQKKATIYNNGKNLYVGLGIAKTTSNSNMRHSATYIVYSGSGAYLGGLFPSGSSIKIPLTFSGYSSYSITLSRDSAGFNIATDSNGTIRNFPLGDPANDEEFCYCGLLREAFSYTSANFVTLDSIGIDNTLKKLNKQQVISALSMISFVSMFEIL
jgi:hypothetical protein